LSFTVYKSSAGSGKTFTLVKEYLRLILPEPADFRHIIAITFTNKAASEMKERILASLKDLAGGPGEQGNPPRNDMLPELIRMTKLSEAEIRLKAGEALHRILHDYSDFSIGTIDSFSHRIIRTFAHDFGLPVNFIVEVDSDELLVTAVDLLLDKVGSDAALTNLLVKFIENRLDDEQDWNIEKTLLNFARILLDEDGQQQLVKLKDLTLDDFSRIAGTLKRQTSAFEQNVGAIASRAVSLIRSLNLDSSAFYHGKSGISTYFEKLSGGSLDGIEPNSFVRKTIDEDKWTSGSATPAEKDAIKSVKNELTGLFHEIRREYETGRNLYHLSVAVLKTLFPMAVLNVIGQLLDGFKKQNNIVHISEFNQRISRFILNEPVPFIYERLGEKYNHILVDEFQDTSTLQWHNLLPLVENSLSKGYFNLVVGDGKQAIYRWRNGDVRQFAELPAIPGSNTNPSLRESQRILGDHARLEQLDTNYRSKRAIVEFNNALFLHLKTLLTHYNQLVYDSPGQKVKDGAEGGYVRLEFAGRELKGDPFREFLGARILETIYEQEAAGFRRQDIAILCRKNKEGSEIARFLLGYGIDVISAESLLLVHSPEVSFLTGFVRLLYGKGSVVLIAELVTYLFEKGRISASGLHELLAGIPAKPGKNFFFRLMQDNGIRVYPDRLRTRPVYDAIEELIRVFYPDATADPYLQFFLDTVLKYSRKHSSSAVDFLEWWDEHKDSFSIIMPDGMNAVRVMSIHKAKGLQFPVVILPFFSEKKVMTKKFLWVDLPKPGLYGLPAAMLDAGKSMEKTEFSEQSTEEKDKSLLDAINLLYVALTRPEERLFVFSPSPPAKSANIDTVPAFLLHYLQQSGLWSDQKSVYEFGTPSAFKPRTNGKLVVKRTLSAMISSDWREKVLIRTSAPEAWDIADPQKNFQWGNLVHTAFSRILKAGDEEPVLMKMSDDGMIDQKQAQQLLERIRVLLEDPQIRPFFLPENRIRVEAGILRENGDVYRPDRVIIRGEEAVVIDFKTGKSTREQEKQIRHYGKLMNELGYANVRKFLVFVEPAINVVEVEG
jgi:ATP-dependent exoDNAse (exonuclease V) beta subunit